ncbi:MAG: hypothetical protein KJO88_05490 [Gammaproteobacteria bacterium]|nr:hypothetical protein [Gammaproteobacteria bacterium]
MNWKERLEREPRYKDFNEWPYIDPFRLPKGKQKRYLRNRKILSRVLSGASHNSVALECMVSSSYISYLLNRSLGGFEDIQPHLTSALIPNVRLRQGQRKLPFSQLSEPRGTRGSFNLLLNKVPNLEKNLNNMLEAFVRDKRHGQNLTPKIFHSEFIRILRENNWPQTHYPFDQERLAYESCRKYFHQKLNSLLIPKAKPKRVISSTTTSNRAYSEIQIDSQTLDLNTSIYLDINGTITPIRLSRLTLFLAIDVSTDCWLAYHLCLSNCPTQQDLLHLLNNIHQPWQKLELLTPGLEYKQGACLPTGLGEVFTNLGVGMIRLDNALCHLANSVSDYICNHLNATLNLGLPAQPKGRNVVEHAFNLINEFTHRFPSTTGSHPKDALKESSKNRKQPPVITLNAFKEMLSVIITAHNATPQNRLHGYTPLESLRNAFDSEILLINYSSIEHRKNPFLRQKIVTVRWIKKENRRPHVNFETLRYTGECLSSEKLVSKKIIIEYDIRDIRKISAFTLSGNSLGTLFAPKSRQDKPLSLQTFKCIRKFTRKHRTSGIDPLGSYYAWLLENKELPKHATELIRIYEECYSQQNNFTNEHFATNNQHSNEQENPITNSRHRSAIPAWSPALIK